jgi:hypothetical protein
VTVPLLAGGYVLGVRCSSEGLAELVAELFRHRYRPEAEPPPNLSFAAEPPASGTAPQMLHRLFFGYSRIVRTLSLRRAVDALWHILDSFDLAAGAKLRLAATVLAEGDRAHVFAPRARSWFGDDERRWLKAGFALVDRPVMEFDLARGRLVVPRPEVEWPDPGTWDRGGLVDRPDATQPSGTFKIATWTPTRQTPPTLAGRLVDAARQVEDRQLLDGRELVVRLADVLDQTPDVGGYRDLADLQRSLLRAQADRPRND